MKITFLGTGTSQGVPVIGCRCRTCLSEDPRDKRLRSSVLIEDGGTTIIIDTGPDFRQQMLRTDVDHIDAILYTHEHRDHIAGLDDIRAFNYIQGKAMDVYGEERTLRALKHTFPYIFAERKYPGVPQLEFHSINLEPFRVNETEIIPVRAMHYRLPVLGYRIENFAYITDTNHVPPEEISKIREVKHLAVCALREKKHISHFNLSQALEFIEKAGPGQAWLTHVSDRMGPYAEASRGLPDNVKFAWDMLSLDI